MKILLLTMALLALNVSPSKAEIELYEYDKAHTQIHFAVNHLGYTTSRGRFMDFDGSLTFNRSEPEKSNVEMVIQTNSIEMGTEKWNDHMRNEDFFNVEKYPTMTFKSTAIEITGDNTAKITGDLTILETTKPVTLDVVFNKAGKSPFGEEYKAGFSATTSLKRSDYGMTYGLPMVGDEIEIMLEVEAVRKGADTLNQ
jgi:polyisoprenoid-binding protein YceI